MDALEEARKALEVALRDHENVQLAYFNWVLHGPTILQALSARECDTCKHFREHYAAVFNRQPKDAP